MIDNKSELPPLHAEGVQQAHMGRRRLLRVGLAATPVVLTLSGRSAMAQMQDCPGVGGLSLPTWNSICPGGEFIGSSHHSLNTGRLGLPPAHWVPNAAGPTFKAPYAWPVAPFENLKIKGQEYGWDPRRYLSYSDIASADKCWKTGTKYNAIFTKSSNRSSFSRILLDARDSFEGYLCAAYLNAKAMPGVYVMTPAEVISLARYGYLVPGSKPLTNGQIKAFLGQTWA